MLSGALARTSLLKEGAMFKVSTEKLMLIAGVVWFIAGRQHPQPRRACIHEQLGLADSPCSSSDPSPCSEFSTSKVFTKMIGKHAARIYGYAEPQKNLFLFFDKKGYIMMAIMMGGGIGLRMSDSFPMVRRLFSTPASGSRAHDGGRRLLSSVMCVRIIGKCPVVAEIGLDIAVLSSHLSSFGSARFDAFRFACVPRHDASPGSPSFSRFPALPPDSSSSLRSRV